MHVSDLAELFRVRGHAVRTRGTEVVFRQCVVCGNDRWNLEASASKGVYHCWAGGCRGTVAALLELVGADVPPDLEVRWDAAGDGRVRQTHVHGNTVALDTQPSAMAYLRSRGVDEATARWLGVAVETEGRYAPRIVIPLHEFWTGTPVGVTTRGYGPADGPKYLNDVDCPDSLPGWRDVTCHYLVLVEGVFDALAVRRAGFGAAMLLGLGSQTHALWWAAQAPPGSTVVVMLDPEAETTARGLVQDLRTACPRVRRATLPAGTDPGSASREQIKQCVLEAI